MALEGRCEARLVAVTDGVGDLAHRHVLAAQQLQRVPHARVEAHVEEGGAEAGLEGALELGLAHADAACDVRDLRRRRVLRHDDAPREVEAAQVVVAAHPRRRRCLCRQMQHLAEQLRHLRFGVHQPQAAFVRAAQQAVRDMQQPGVHRQQPMAELRDAASGHEGEDVGDGDAVAIGQRREVRSAAEHGHERVARAGFDAVHDIDAIGLAQQQQGVGRHGERQRIARQPEPHGAREPQMELEQVFAGRAVDAGAVVDEVAGDDVEGGTETVELPGPVPFVALQLQAGGIGPLAGSARQHLRGLMLRQRREDVGHAAARRRHDGTEQPRMRLCPCRCAVHDARRRLEFVQVLHGPPEGVQRSASAPTLCADRTRGKFYFKGGRRSRVRRGAAAAAGAGRPRRAADRTAARRRRSRG